MSSGSHRKLFDLGQLLSSTRTSLSLPLLLVLLAAIVGCGSKPESAKSAKGASEEPAMPVTLVSPRGDLDEIPREFDWEKIPDAVEYSVKIADADAIWPIFVKRVKDAPLVLSSEELKAISRGRIHAWEVEALDPSGNPIAKGSAQFRVKPPEPPPA